MTDFLRTRNRDFCEKIPILRSLGIARIHTDTMRRATYLNPLQCLQAWVKYIAYAPFSYRYGVWAPNTVYVRAAEVIYYTCCSSRLSCSSERCPWMREGWVIGGMTSFYWQRNVGQENFNRQRESGLTRRALSFWEIFAYFSSPCVCFPCYRFSTIQENPWGQQKETTRWKTKCVYVCFFFLSLKHYLA